MRLGGVPDRRSTRSASRSSATRPRRPPRSRRSSTRTRSPAGSSATLAERTSLVVELEALGLSVAESQANFVWFDVGENEPEIVKELGQRGVLVRAGGALGRPGALRVTVGTQAENERLIEALGALL